jgi:hypothetical protein
LLFVHRNDRERLFIQVKMVRLLHILTTIKTLHTRIKTSSVIHASLFRHTRAGGYPKKPEVVLRIAIGLSRRDKLTYMLNLK